MEECTTHTEWIKSWLAFVCACCVETPQVLWGVGLSLLLPRSVASLSVKLTGVLLSARRQVVRPETELVVVCIPDPPSIRKVIAIAEAAQEAGAQLLLFNPRLASGDIGVGLALRDTFRDFTLQMQVAYSIRPVGDGSVYKCYPAPWKVFLGDPEEEGRYILAAEQNTRPNSEEIFNLMDALDDGTLGKEDDEDTDGGDGNAGGLFGAARKGIREAQKFARDISRL